MMWESPALFLVKASSYGSLSSSRKHVEVSKMLLKKMKMKINYAGSKDKLAHNEAKPSSSQWESQLLSETPLSEA